MRYLFYQPVCGPLWWLHMCTLNKARYRKNKFSMRGHEAAFPEHGPYLVSNWWKGSECSSPWVALRDISPAVFSPSSRKLLFVVKRNMQKHTKKNKINNYVPNHKPNQYNKKQISCWTPKWAIMFGLHCCVSGHSIYFNESHTVKQYAYKTRDG